MAVKELKSYYVDSGSDDGPYVSTYSAFNISPFVDGSVCIKSNGHSYHLGANRIEDFITAIRMAAAEGK